tara:strand:- start:393 stop:620 length:228 start_codon:yes stop_codon:yes gene_type:complete
MYRKNDKPSNGAVRRGKTKGISSRVVNISLAQTNVGNNEMTAATRLLKTYYFKLDFPIFLKTGLHLPGGGVTHLE